MTNGTDSKMPIERRASTRASLRLSVAHGDDDEHDLAMMGISDGFRPLDVAQNHVSDPPIPLLPTVAQPQRPSSIAKPPQPRESFSLRHDGGMGSLADSIVAGSSSNAGPVLARSESPYQGPSGPSFPYQMYPQDVRSGRTDSIATTATVPASEASYSGPSNPTHPYQMYPQNTPPVTDASPATPAPAPIPVGFAGATDNYQRRIGSEGEEAADMIGPDGHTEQLPPYTRYPDEAYQRKIAGIGGLPTIEASGASSVASSSASTSTATTTQVPAIAGAGGIGLATRNPEFSSTDDLSLQGANSPQSRQSVRSFNSEGSHHDINTAAQAVINEKKPLKKWQIVAKRKVWGVVPCWALTITLVIIVMLAVVLGTVLGFIFNKPKHPQGPPDSGSFATMTYDASPLSTVPPGLSPLPGGEYALPLMLTRSPTTCFNDSTQAQAWDCNQVFAQLSLSINKLSDTPSTSQYSMTLAYNDSFTIETNQYSYGMQPPSVDNVTMLLVTDVNEPSRGPAWAFEVTYNKTVIIPESLFPPPSSSSNTKRDPPPPPPGGGFSGGNGFKGRKGLAQSGDKPWICHWDGTVLEVFVYPNQNNSQPTLIFSDDSSSTSSRTGSLSTTSATTTTAAAAAAAATTTSDSASAATITTDADMQGSNFRNGYVNTRYHRRQASSSAPTATTTGSATTTISSGVFDTSVPAPSDFQVPFFPRVIKMEERRLSGTSAAQPYCQQYQINSNGPATPLKDSNGNFIISHITEIEPGDETSHDRKYHRKQRLVQREVIEEYLNQGIKPRQSDSDMSDCGCMWWTT